MVINFKMKDFIESRKWVWGFFSNIKDRPNAENMLNQLTSFGFDYFIDEDFSSKSINDRSAILRQCLFVVCPASQRSLEVSELYLALDNGCIPIVESSDYWMNVFGENPILQINEDWSGLGSSIQTLIIDIDSMSQYRKRLFDWWTAYKKSIVNEVSSLIAANQNNNSDIYAKEDNKLSLKRAEFFKIKNKWAEFLNYDFLNFAAKQTDARQIEVESFSCYNPGASIAIVTLYTSEIAEYSIESEYSIKRYCERNNYTFYVYRDSLDKDSNPNWSKPKAILNHIKNHDFIVWIDSDTLIFNPSKKLEGILDKCSSTKQIFACEDIGSNNKNLPKGSLFNSGVVIFKNHDYTYNILKKWWDFRHEGDTSSLYSSGGDQEILISIIKKSDPFLHNLKIFPMNKFNTEPRMVDDQTFIIHFMAYPYLLKCLFMKYWNSD